MIERDPRRMAGISPDTPAQRRTLKLGQSNNLFFNHETEFMGRLQVAPDQHQAAPGHHFRRFRAEQSQIAGKGEPPAGTARSRSSHKPPAITVYFVRPGTLAGTARVVAGGRRCHIGEAMARTVPVSIGSRADAHRTAEFAVKAVLGPTNTGKTHLAIERLCAHSSGAIGFPLRLLAREVYDRVCAIKGESRVALITGEERIEPSNARWLLCTVEAMPVDRDLAFVAVDEAQLGADRERGHVFTDRLLHSRGREETMILGSSSLEPMVRALVPGAEVIGRPRFSTLSHAGATKLSRIPPRSAIVAFSAEQVYAVAEMLRRFRGGAAVVMGGLSPQTRNAQVAMFQSGEVDYLVATDAIGMGLNLDLAHVAFAGLSKFDGFRQRRLTLAEMAQIAGRAGRHQRDGTFGTLAGTRRHDAEFTPDEVYAIEEHRFPPLTRLYWRNAEPSCASLDELIGDLETPPDRPELALAPEGIDLAVLKRLADEPGIGETARGEAQVARFWQVCRLPDFRAQGADTHARFVARLWQDLKDGLLGNDVVAQAIAQLDQVSGDIDTLQFRLASIRSWSYIAQRSDWVLAPEEMAARARAVEARLSDALHARLTERFVNRRTTVLMRKLGSDVGMVPVRLEGATVLVDDEPLGELSGFTFRIDPQARLGDRKLLLAAAERHLPRLLADRAEGLASRIAEGTVELDLAEGSIAWRGSPLAALAPGRSPLTPRIEADRALAGVPEPARKQLFVALETWLDTRLAPLGPLRRLEAASRSAESGPELRALLIRLIEGGGLLERAGSGLADLAPAQREQLRRLKVRIGALDLFVPAMLRPRPLALWQALTTGQSSRQPRVAMEMPPVIAATRRLGLPPGYRRLGNQAIRIDLAEKLLRAAHDQRTAASRRDFVLDPALARSMGLTEANYANLLRLAGFRLVVPPPLPPDSFGPPRPAAWRWRPPHRRRQARDAPTRRDEGAFAALARLVG
jgi:ATP-dependent RNA helicase SUPV3L1/SUV3